MRNSLLLVCLIAACFSLAAKDFVKGRVISEGNNRPVSFATVKVEYPDTIISIEADRKGNFKFNPLSFPFTITATGVGMTEAVFGVMSMPDDTLVLELISDSSAGAPLTPSRKPAWSTAWSRRLTSKFIVRSTASHK